VLEEGQLVKIARLERYQPEARGSEGPEEQGPVQGPMQVPVER
jgi:hypothetical protein